MPPLCAAIARFWHPAYRSAGLVPRGPCSASSMWPPRAKAGPCFCCNYWFNGVLPEGLFWSVVVPPKVRRRHGGSCGRFCLWLQAPTLQVPGKLVVWLGVMALVDTQLQVSDSYSRLGVSLGLDGYRESINKVHH
jgi:hypothetical protein